MMMGYQLLLLGLILCLPGAYISLRLARLNQRSGHEDSMASNDSLHLLLLILAAVAFATFLLLLLI
jgi:hypothetical protein